MVDISHDFSAELKQNLHDPQLVISKSSANFHPSRPTPLTQVEHGTNSQPQMIVQNYPTHHQPSITNLTQSTIKHQPDIPSQADQAADSANYSNFINSPTDFDL